MTWPLFSGKAVEVFNTWNTCVKLAWGVPRSTHRYFVDNLLSSGIPSLKASLLSCYMTFHESVSTSSSLEVRIVASLATEDIRSTSGSNIHGLRQLLSQLDSSPGSSMSAKQKLLSERSTMPAQDTWRLPCLKKFIEKRYSLQAALQDTKEIDELIDSLCSS